MDGQDFRRSSAACGLFKRLLMVRRASAMSYLYVAFCSLTFAAAAHTEIVKNDVVFSRCDRALVALRHRLSTQRAKQSNPQIARKNDYNWTRHFTMGIQGLIPFLKDIHEKISISEYAGKRVAIDAYCWLHRGAYACAFQLAQGIKADQ